MKRIKHDRKHAAQGKRRPAASHLDFDPHGHELPVPPRKASTEPFTPRGVAQERYLAAIKANTVTIGLGPAGAGKSYVAGCYAAMALQGHEGYESIILTRPAVEAGEKLGFLPGEKEDKYAPYVEPFRDILEERLGKGRVDYMLKSGQLKGRPLAYMRGSTFKNAIVILDEAQNTTPAQMKMFLTRIGENCKVIINGDLGQKDIPGPSGLAVAQERLRDVRSIRTVRFGTEDIVRSGIVQDIVEAWEAPQPDPQD